MSKANKLITSLPSSSLTLLRLLPSCSFPAFNRNFFEFEHLFTPWAFIGFSVIYNFTLNMTFWAMHKKIALVGLGSGSYILAYRTLRPPVLDRPRLMLITPLIRHGWYNSSIWSTFYSPPPNCQVLGLSRLATFLCLQVSLKSEKTYL